MKNKTPLRGQMSFSVPAMMDEAFERTSLNRSKYMRIAGTIAMGLDGLLGQETQATARKLIVDRIQNEGWFK